MRLLPLLIVAALATQAAAEVGTKEGNVHPDPSLQNVDGRGGAQLSRYRGKKVLLFNFASW